MTNLNTSAAEDMDNAKARRPKQTRAEQLRTMLTRKTGASVAQIQNKFGWQPHSARAAISSLRKAGHMIERNDTDKGPVYRISLPELAQ
jgi:DNA-binding transcriptional regulator PaaX